jgi:hypothetical protein
MSINNQAPKESVEQKPLGTIQGLVELAMPKELQAIQQSIENSIRQSESVIAQTLKSSYDLINSATQQLNGGLESQSTVEPPQCQPQETSELHQQQSGSSDQVLPQNSLHQNSPTQNMPDADNLKLSNELALMTQKMQSSLENVKKTIYSTESQLQSGLTQVNQNVAEVYKEQVLTNTEQASNKSPD